MGSIIRKTSHMKKNLISSKTPEDREVEIKQADLNHLEETLSKEELELVTLQAQLHSFQNLYFRMVGAKYVKLDELNAQIAERLARLKPKDKEAQKQAEEARRQAEESTKTAEDIKKTKPIKDFESNERIKRLYRRLALLVHPDMTTDPREKERRHHIMTEVNRAYEEGDEECLLKILEEWQNNPDSVKGDGPGAELVRTIRKIAQVKRRLSEIEKEMNKLKQSELYQLKIEVEKAKKAGKNLLKQMVDQIDKQIIEAKHQLNRIK